MQDYNPLNSLEDRPSTRLLLLAESRARLLFYWGWTLKMQGRQYQYITHTALQEKQTRPRPRLDRGHNQRRLLTAARVRCFKPKSANTARISLRDRCAERVRRK